MVLFNMNSFFNVFLLLFDRNFFFDYANNIIRCEFFTFGFKIFFFFVISSSFLHFFHFWIECITQSIREQVKGKHQDSKDHNWDNDLVWSDKDRFKAVVDQGT